MRGRLSRIRDWEGLARRANYDPATMAALCPASLRQLERFFLARFGQTPREWMRDVRCRLARKYAAEGWSTKAIAAELKYPSVSAFCHEFKRVCGASPQSFGPIYCKKPEALKPKHPRR